MVMDDYYTIINYELGLRRRHLLFNIWRSMPCITQRSSPISKERVRALQTVFWRSLLADLGAHGQLIGLVQDTRCRSPPPWKAKVKSEDEKAWTRVFLAAALVLEGFLGEEVESLMGKEKWPVQDRWKFVKELVREQIYGGVWDEDLDKRMEEAREWVEDNYGEEEEE